MNPLGRKKAIVLILAVMVCFLLVGCRDETHQVSEAPPPLEKGGEIHIQEEVENIINGGDELSDTGENEAEHLNSQASKKTTLADREVVRQERIEEKSRDMELMDTVSIATVTVSIVGNEDIGVILKPTVVEIEEGETVVEVLKKVARQNQIPISVRGKGSAAYVEGINNIFEFDHGAKSGWLYKVNGNFYSKSSGAYKLKADDVIEWVYTLDMGRDVGVDFAGLGGTSDE